MAKIALNDMEQVRANELSTIICEALKEIDPEEFECEDSGGPVRSAALADEIAERLAAKGVNID